MQNKSIFIVAAIAAIIAIAGVAAFMIANGGDDNPYKEVEDTGKMIDVGTVLEYDAEVTIDNVTKKGTMKMHILGFNPSGIMYKLEMDESLGLPVTEQLMLSNDSSSAKDEKSDEVWKDIDTVNFGKLRMVCSHSESEGMTTEVYLDPYTGIQYREHDVSDTMEMKLELKSIDGVVWQDSKDEIEPSEDLGKTLTYDIFMDGEKVGQDVATIVTNPDKDGIYYMREITTIDGQTSVVYQPQGGSSEDTDDSDGPEFTGETITIMTIDGEKTLSEIRSDMGMYILTIYVDEETNTPYRMVMSAMGSELVYDYQGKTIDRFWEEEE